MFQLQEDDINVGVACRHEHGPLILSSFDAVKHYSWVERKQFLRERGSSLVNAVPNVFLIGADNSCINLHRADRARPGPLSRG